MINPNTSDKDVLWPSRESKAYKGGNLYRGGRSRLWTPLENSPTKLAQATTEAAHKINLITRQQRSSIEQVTGAMDDIGSITNMVAAGTEQTVISTEQLKDLAEQLTALVEKFRASIS